MVEGIRSKFFHSNNDNAFQCSLTLYTSSFLGYQVPQQNFT